jgi:hypothetical protein
MLPLIALFVVHFAPLCLGHAGFFFPQPRVVCNASSFSNCGLTTAPCGGVPSSSATTNVYTVGATTEVDVYQYVSHYTNTSQNTYQYNVYSTNSWTLLSTTTYPQSQFSTQNNVAFAIQPAGTPLQSSPGYYTIQLVFNATSGGGAVYYSCIDYQIVTNTPTPASSSSPSLVTSSLASLLTFTLVALLI